MNAQHSSRNDSWRTPRDIVERAGVVLGYVDLDPASDTQANERIQARAILTRKKDDLATPWDLGDPKTIWLNPPGGKSGNKSMTALFWEKLMRCRDNGALRHAIFMAFSLEALQTTQASGPGRRIIDFPFCVPKKRIRFDHPTDTAKQAPSHSNAIVYVPGTENRTDVFMRAFHDVGGCANVIVL